MVPKSVQTCFEHVLGRFFEKVFLLSVPWRVELSKIFKKNKKLSNQKLFKIAKKPKIVPKGLQTCFGHVLGNFFEKFFLPSVPWRVESSKIFKKNKKLSKFQKCPQSFPKVSKRVLNKFWGDFFEKSFFVHFFVQCSLEGRVVENFQKTQKFLKFQKCPKSLSKVSKRVLNMFWANFFEKIFLPLFHGGSSLRKFSKKSKTFQNCKNAQNLSQKCPNVFWTCFG